MAIRVFIADDHAVFRNGLRILLEKEKDIEVVGETGSGPETLHALETCKADVVLLDINLPGLSGNRVAEELLKKRPAPAIVVLTMHEDEYYLQELLRIGARGYVLKKSTGTEVLHAIRAAFRGDTYIDPALANLVVSPYVGRTNPKKSSRLDLLTQREKEVCTLLAYGHTNAEVGEKLCISDRTVETHRNNIMGKLGLTNRAELVRFAIDNGLLKVE
ncbi:MAG TPA: response regulator transcription factor [Candidatus Hydrogenedentes bacterium]|mgnify:CR=1 FL=1|nr:response regulator transcription factor [Candidatus Hydrogenedentota bacterium]